jgi:hypothetical protein
MLGWWLLRQVRACPSKVRIAVDGASYQLSYRSGYFADGSVRDKHEDGSPRAQLLGNGEKLEVNELRERPIIFKAIVLSELDDATTDPSKFPGLVRLPSPKKRIRSIHHPIPVAD